MKFGVGSSSSAAINANMDDQDKNLINDDVDMKDGEVIKQEALAVESIFSFFFVVG